MEWQETQNRVELKYPSVPAYSHERTRSRRGTNISMFLAYLGGGIFIIELEDKSKNEIHSIYIRKIDY